MAQVLLLARDWKVRALLRAQLLEEGIDVEAHASARLALLGLERAPHLPDLVVADLTFSPAPDREADRLARWASRLPVWVIASHTLPLRRSLAERGFERVIYRPVDAGGLVEEIKLRLRGN